MPQRFHREMNMRSQRGQSLVVGLIFIPVIVLFVLYLFNVSQQNLNKTRLQNNADAAVLSGSRYIARDQNFKAYTNRAMIANHVAIGQYVGLSSWMTFLVKTIENGANLTRAIPVVGQIFAGLEAGANIFNNAMRFAAPFIISEANLVINSISASQELVSNATALTTVSTLRNILRANDADVNLDVGSSRLVAQVALYSANQGSFNRSDTTGRYNDFFKVIDRSRDPFLTDRSHEWDFPFSIEIPLGCNPFLPSPNFWTKQTGGTDLAFNGRNDKETWTSMDTLSFHKEWWDWGGIFSSPGCERSEIPVGWGSGHAGKDNSTNRYNQYSYYGKSKSINGRSASYAPGNEEDLSQYYSGIANFYSLVNTDKNNEEDNLTIVVSKPIGRITTSDDLSIGTINQNTTRNVDINIEEGLNVPQNKQAVAAKAKIFYYRPRDLWGNGRYEYKNLYNPYWDSTLQEISTAERAQIYLQAYGLSFGV